MRAGVQPLRAEQHVPAHQGGIGPAVAAQIEPGRQQNTAERAWLILVAQGQEHGERKAPARRVARHYDGTRLVRAGQRGQDRTGILERRRMGMLGGQPVVG